MIAVIDYGMGNLHSVAKAIECLGEIIIISNKKEDIKKADKIVLPGVGAFWEGIKNLKQKNLIKILEKEVIKKKKPFLGICLGMQLLSEQSNELGNHRGLGWIPFKVKKFNFPDNSLKIPHMGWETIKFDEKNLLFKGIKETACFYFVHSYHLELNKDNKKFAIAICNYGYPFAAAVQKENIFATQFHPEKSQTDCLKILKNFIEYQPNRREGKNG